VKLAAFDLATSTGVAWGEVGGKPESMTWDLREGGESRPLRFLFLMRLLRGFIIAHPTVHVVYEAPQPMAVMGRLGTGEATIAILRGTVALGQGEGGGEDEGQGSARVGTVPQAYPGF
jgi:hypothetical protein